MIKGRQWLALALFHLLLAPVTGNAESLSVGGTGSSEALVRLLFHDFRKQNPGASLNQLSGLGSGGALKALAAGRLDLAVVARPLHPDEAAHVGQRFALADTPLVLASRDGQMDAGISVEQVALVYEGKLQTWQDGSPIRLILRPSFESDTLLLRNLSPAMARAVTAASRRPGMVTVDNDLDTLRLIAETPGSLGPTTLGLLRTTNTRLVVLPIGGVTPSLATLNDGTYPWRKTLTVVLPLRPSALAERFAAFLRSGRAHRLLQSHDYLPGAA